MCLSSSLQIGIANNSSSLIPSSSSPPALVFVDWRRLMMPFFTLWHQ